MALSGCATGDGTAADRLRREVTAALRPVFIDPARGFGVVQHGTMLAGVVQKSDPIAPIRGLSNLYSYTEPGRVSPEAADLTPS